MSVAGEPHKTDFSFIAELGSPRERPGKHREAVYPHCHPKTMSWGKQARPRLGLGLISRRRKRQGNNKAALLHQQNNHDSFAAGL